MVVAFVITLVPLGFVLFTVIAKGASIISWSVPDRRPDPADRRFPRA